MHNNVNVNYYYYIIDTELPRTRSRNLLKDFIYSECESKPLGMESGAITNDQISASSQYNAAHGWVRARLNLQPGSGGNGGWSARTIDANQWIQVDLRKIMTVKGVATQGRVGVSRQWVTKYKLKYSDDGQTFSDYKEEGQTDAKVIEITVQSNIHVTSRH